MQLKQPSGSFASVRIQTSLSIQSRREPKAPPHALALFSTLLRFALLRCRKIYEPSGMKAEGRPRARECRECEVVMHEARSDGDLQPDGRDSSKLNAGLKKKKGTAERRCASAVCEVTGKQGAACLT